MSNPPDKARSHAHPKLASLSERLTTLKARDVMTPEPVVLTEDQSLSVALVTLERHAITGCPVVDQRERLVGMLSLWDLARTKEKSNATGASATASQSSDVLSMAGSIVKERMSRKVGAVAETQPLVEVARTMCREHWHRVPVVADDQRLKGIVSTMDVLAALVNAFDEFAFEGGQPPP